jgi:hypothetical protein
LVRPLKNPFLLPVCEPLNAKKRHILRIAVQVSDFRKNGCFFNSISLKIAVFFKTLSGKAKPYVAGGVRGSVSL